MALRQTCDVHIPVGSWIDFGVAKALEEHGLGQHPLGLHQHTVILLAVHQRQTEAPLVGLRTPRPHADDLEEHAGGGRGGGR